MAKDKEPQENGSQESPGTEAKASKVREAASKAELKTSLERLARGAKRREAELRGDVLFKPRGDLELDDIEVRRGEGPPPTPGAGPAPHGMDSEVLEDVAASLGEALQATGEFAAVQLEVSPPDADMAAKVGRSWVRVLRLYGKIDPRAAAVVAACTTTVAWGGPSALEAWLKYQEEQRQQAMEGFPQEVSQEELEAAGAKAAGDPE